MNRYLVVFAIVIISITSKAQQLSLAGKWVVQLDSANVGMKNQWQLGKFTGQTINLPGTLDDAGIGKPVVHDTLQMNKAVMLSLSRKHTYIGKAWYRREFTLAQELSAGELSLERVIWETDCWIDGQYLGMQNGLSAQQVFNLPKLKAGKHQIVLRIDNDKKFDISFSDFTHAYTDGTQIKWNGVIGNMVLIPYRKVAIKELQLFPDVNSKSVQANLTISSINPEVVSRVRYQIYQKGKLVGFKTVDRANFKSDWRTAVSLKEVLLWDEFNPNLYTMQVSLLDQKNRVLAHRRSTFGFRQLSNDQGILKMNDKRLFLRGTLDCNSYPLTGHPPMDQKSWIKIYQTIKSYGLNHVRYHSWCPPEAAFQVADSLGLYLQVELPLWSLKVGEDKPTLGFLQQESQRIIAAYGNHPSFCFWSMGNELQGDFKWLNNLVHQLKQQDTRRFYTATTFTFQRGHGLAPEPYDDFFITQYTKKGWVRGQGVFNAEQPNFNKNYSLTADSLPVPLIAHEVGQYSVFPNLKEIQKYTGVLDPLNLKAVRNDMRKKGLLSQANTFKLATGKFAALLYKEEIERALKTNRFSGFQLLDLHDFPGQGTALVGLLDVFWQSKGLLSSSNFRQFCSETVPLLRFEKASFLNSENFKAQIQVAHFGAQPLHADLQWEVSDQQNQILFSGNMLKQRIGSGTNTFGSVTFPLAIITAPKQLRFTIRIKGTAYENSWPFWVYPATPKPTSDLVKVTGSTKEALTLLEQGETVLLNPDKAKMAGVDGIFTPVFWSPVHFPDQPGTMGLLCDPKHPALKGFPTDFHSNWQWWDLVLQSKTMVLDGYQGHYTPIVTVIDNFFKNRSMATVIEAKVGKGKLILCSMDISTNLAQRIEARQLRLSLLQYAGSAQFNPKHTLSPAQLNELVHSKEE